MSKYGVISGPYFPVFSPNTGKYEPEITPYLDTFNAVKMFEIDHWADNCIQIVVTSGMRLINSVGGWL